MLRIPIDRTTTVHPPKLFDIKDVKESLETARLSISKLQDELIQLKTTLTLLSEHVQTQETQCLDNRSTLETKIEELFALYNQSIRPPIPEKITCHSLSACTPIQIGFSCFRASDGTVHITSKEPIFFSLNMQSELAISPLPEKYRPDSMLHFVVAGSLDNTSPIRNPIGVCLCPDGRLNFYRIGATSRSFAKSASVMISPFDISFHTQV